MEFFSAIPNWCGGPPFFSGNGSGWLGWAGFHLGPFLQLLLIGFIIYLAARLISRRSGGASTSSPNDILRQRFASGEIDEKTYNQMRVTLRGSDDPK